MVPEGNFLAVNLPDRKNIFKMRLHANAQKSSFWIALNTILQFGLKGTGISGIEGIELEVLSSIGESVLSCVIQGELHLLPHRDYLGGGL